ncbi:protein translocase subunit SecD [Polycladomyces subterraneus]|uniref:Protein translocase subunit SecD n=1 Tax=Polycladomyces subterraneus TaxID=1016997 RepID=A0ABT8IQV2_9BACL|nr:protein translocase subunit SecD [Polycladomyces subterraneus]MDN4595185.1 protein translocase subunit SecD [Polycladomyces subterraneus]
MRVRWGQLVWFSLLVIAVLATVALTTKDVVKRITLGLDLRGGFEVLYVAKPHDKEQKITPKTLASAAEALRNRIDVLGVTEPDITIEGSNRIRVQLAGVKDKEKAREILGKPARLTFRDPTGKKVLLDGSDLKEGGASQDYDQSGRPAVSLQLKNPQQFYDLTRKYVGQPMPIYLDNQRLDAPVINEPIPNGKAIITGNFTAESAKTLANLLNAGSLPVDLQEIQSYSVDASLGQDSLMKSLRAGLIALVMIFVFVIGYYRLPGLIAAVTLVAYSYLVLLTFSLLHVTLTLPGIAAYILGIGMAVDANIIMYERIKEEMRRGKSIPAAVRSGSRRSFLTIFDANITTVLAAAVLFYFGTAGVKGFAVSLIVSIAVSFLTAVALARILMNLLLKANVLKSPALFGVKESEIGEL